jgi:hypothetical protein
MEIENKENETTYIKKTTTRKIGKKTNGVR